MFLISRDLKAVFCGVLMDGKEFLLIIPAENKSDADRTLKSGLEQSQPLSRWLSDYLILSILVDTFISKISFPMQPGPEIGSISDA